MLMRSNKPETAVYGSSIGLRYGCAHAHGDDDTMGLSTYYAACTYARTPLRTAEMWGKSNDITEFTRLRVDVLPFACKQVFTIVLPHFL